MIWARQKNKGWFGDLKISPRDTYQIYRTLLYDMKMASHGIFLEIMSTADISSVKNASM
jgi:hypothetical protein